jgi:hypothetical protein
MSHADGTLPVGALSVTVTVPVLNGLLSHHHAPA